MLAMSEVVDSFTGRPMIVLDNEFAFAHPSAFAIAQIAADIPVLLIQISTFSLIIYFMVGLTMSAASFFTYWIVIFAATMVSVISFTLYDVCQTKNNGISA